MDVDSIRFNDPKVIGAAVLLFLAGGLTLYNCAGSQDGEALSKVEICDQILRVVGQQTLMAVQEGKSPTLASQLPVLKGGPKGGLDPWGTEFTVEWTAKPAKCHLAVIRSAGPDKTPKTADDMVCTVDIYFQPGPGYNVHVIQSLEVATGT